MRTAVSIRNLSFRYAEEAILSEVSAVFPRGQLSVILGRNGSGKSTLFRIIAGLEKKYDGQVFIGADERRQLKVGSKKGLRLGFMTQFHQMTFPFSVREVIMTGRAAFSKFSPSEQDKQVVEEVLKKLNLEHLGDKPYTTLSGGERQLVMLCRVLVQQPDILLLDEPTNHLDLHYQVQVLQNIKQLVSEGTTVLCVMHDPNLAMMFGEAFYVMHQHKLIDVNGREPSAIKALLEDTYQLPLLQMNNQGKLLVVPDLNRDHD